MGSFSTLGLLIDKIKTDRNENHIFVHGNSRTETVSARTVNVKIVYKRKSVLMINLLTIIIQ